MQLYGIVFNRFFLCATEEEFNKISLLISGVQKWKDHKETSSSIHGDTGNFVITQESGRSGGKSWPFTLIIVAAGYLKTSMRRSPGKESLYYV